MRQTERSGCGKAFVFVFVALGLAFLVISGVATYMVLSKLSAWYIQNAVTFLGILVAFVTIAGGTSGVILLYQIGMSRAVDRAHRDDLESIAKLGALARLMPANQARISPAYTYPELPAETQLTEANFDDVTAEPIELS